MHVKFCFADKFSIWIAYFNCFINIVFFKDMLCYLETVFKSLSCLNGSFLNKTHYYCNSKNSGVDFDNLSSVFELIYKTQNSSVRDVVSIIVL